MEAEASAFTVSAGLASCDSDSRAVGGASGLNVMLAVAGGDVRPPVSVTTSETVYVPGPA